MDNENPFPFFSLLRSLRLVLRRDLPTATETIHPAKEETERVVDKDEDPDDDGDGKGMLAKAGAKKKKKDKGARRGRTIIYDEDADTFISGRAAGLNEEDARLE